MLYRTTRAFGASTLAFMFCCVPLDAHSAIPESCTTTERIHFPTTSSTPPTLAPEQIREAVLVALGSADVDVSWARQTFTGQWFYEYEDEEALYAGYTIRSHYLRVAIILDSGELTTIVCDSRNLDQTKKKIHRKVPGWKGTLDNNIRIALGQAAEYYRNHPVSKKEGNMAVKLDNLESLRKSGVLTEQEYSGLRQRILDTYVIE